MVRKDIKVGIGAFVVGTLIGLSAMVASAASAEGPYGYYSIWGYNYRNISTVSNASIWAMTYAEDSDWVQVPVGYIGVQARLFKSGVLCKSTTWKYNDTVEVGHNTGTPNGSACGSGVYYSQGASAGYNGNGYTEYSTFASPSLNY